MYIHDDYIIAHKLVLATAYWPGLWWQFQNGFPEPLKTCLGNPVVLTLIQLVYFHRARFS